MDELCYEITKKKCLPDVDLIKLKNIETKNLLSIKKDRTFSEYCWTITPITPKIVFDRNPNAKRVTYLDADLWFRKSPKRIFEEFEKSKKEVLITEHAYDPEYDQSEKYGKYCVQFMIFKKGGENIRKCWENRCLEWCFAKEDEGRFGDQKYLDDWTYRFPGKVHVFSQKELIQAPWNAKKFSYSDSVIWHFHGLRIQGRKIILFLRYKIPYSTIKNIYIPYVGEICKIMKNLPIEIYQGKSESWVIHFCRILESFICTLGSKFSKYKSHNIKKIDEYN